MVSPNQFSGFYNPDEIMKSMCNSNNDFSMLKCYTISGDVLYYCTGNTSGEIGELFSDEFTPDALHFNYELLATIDMMNRYIERYQKENPDNKIIKVECVGLSIAPIPNKNILLYSDIV